MWGRVSPNSLLLFFRPRRDTVPNSRLGKGVGMPKVTRAVSGFLFPNLETSEMGAERIAKERGPTRFQPSRSPIRGPKKIPFENYADRLHGVEPGEATSR